MSRLLYELRGALYVVVVLASCYGVAWAARTLLS